MKQTKINLVDMSHTLSQMNMDLIPTDVHLNRCPPHWCPKVTRLKVLAGTFIIIGASLLVLFRMLEPPFIITKNVCCDNRSSSIPHTSRIAHNKMPGSVYATEQAEQSYPDYIKNIRARHTKRRLPQCIIIGVRKGGTRALLEFLNIHPYIQAAKSEMHFFDYYDNFNKGFDWYRKRMPFTYADQITIEKTPSYFIEDEVPERLHAMNKSIKLLLIVRDPTQRAISDYTQILANKVARNKSYYSFEELAIRPNGEVNRSYNAVKRSVYHKHMKRWLEWFPLEQFLVISGENFVANPLEELRRVEKFLGLEHKIHAGNLYFNKTKGFYCIRNETIEKCLADSKGRKHAPVDPEVIQKLQEFYHPLNQKFYQLVRQNFQWP